MHILFCVVFFLLSNKSFFIDYPTKSFLQQLCAKSEKKKTFMKVQEDIFIIHVNEQRLLFKEFNEIVDDVKVKGY